MKIKSIKGARSEIFVEIDYKILVIQGELTMTSEFYADASSITNWEEPNHEVEMSEQLKKNIIKEIQKYLKKTAVPVIFEDQI